MLFVDYYRSDILKRSKNRCPRSHYYLRFSAAYPQPLAELRARSKSAVESRDHVTAESLSETFLYLSCKSYLRKQNYDRSALTEDLCGDSHIDLCFAAVSHSFYKKSAEFFVYDAAADLLSSFLLGLRELIAGITSFDP